MSEFELIEKCRVLLSFNAKYIDFSEDLRDLIDELNQWKRNGRNMELVNINAWQRELCAFDGKIYNKRHHIDAMVVTTQRFIEEWKRDRAQLEEQAALIEKCSEFLEFLWREVGMNDFAVEKWEEITEAIAAQKSGAA